MLPSPSPSPSAAPRQRAVPPAGWAAAAAAGPGFGSVSGSRELQPGSVLFSASFFASLFPRLWASGTGWKGRLSASRGSPTLGWEDGAPGQPSRAGAKARSSGTAFAARAGGRPGCGLRPGLRAPRSSPRWYPAPSSGAPVGRALSP